MRFHIHYNLLNWRNRERYKRDLERLYLVPQRKIFCRQTTAPIHDNHAIHSTPPYTVYIHNTIKTHRIYIYAPEPYIIWKLISHKKAYTKQLWKNIQEYLTEHLPHIIPRHAKTVQLKLKRTPGLLRVPLKLFLKAFVSTHAKTRVTAACVLLPRSHGYRTYKKMARRKKHLQRIRARHLKRAL